MYHRVAPLPAFSPIYSNRVGATGSVLGAKQSGVVSTAPVVRLRTVPVTAGGTQFDARMTVGAMQLSASSTVSAMQLGATSNVSVMQLGATSTVNAMQLCATVSAQLDSTQLGALHADTSEMEHVAAFEQTSCDSVVMTTNQATTEGSPDSPYGLSDLLEFPDCLDFDFLVDGEATPDAAKSNLVGCETDQSCLALDDVELSSFINSIESGTFNYGSLFSANSSSSNDGENKFDANAQTCEQSAVDRLLEDLGLLPNDAKYEQPSADVVDLCESDGAYFEATASEVADSPVAAASPSSSSGCESDFTSSYEDPFLFSADEIGFTSLSGEEPFTDLFPALY
jgi:hypothetical protein